MIGLTIRDWLWRPMRVQAIGARESKCAPVLVLAHGAGAGVAVGDQ